MPGLAILIFSFIHFFLFVKILNLAYKKRRSVATWAFFGLISSVIAYIILRNSKTLIKDKSYGQSIIPTDLIERTYKTKEGQIVIGDGVVVLNQDYAPDGKYKLSFALYMTVKDKKIVATSFF